MVLPALAFLKRVFPERQVLLRSGETVRYLSLSGWLQASILVAVLGVGGALGGLAGAYHNLHKAIHRKEADISAAANRAAALESVRDALDRTDQLYLQLSDQLDQAKQQLDAATSDNESLRNEIEADEARDAALEKTRQTLESKLNQAEHTLASKNGNVAQLTKELAQNRSELKGAMDARAGLQQKLQSLQANSLTASGRSTQLRLSLAQREQELKQIGIERDRLRAQLDQGEASQPKTYVSQVEQLIASTGLDLDHMLAKLDATPADEGGPFIGLQQGDLAKADAAREKALKNLVYSLPLAAPLDHFIVTSPFGPRIDPINHREGFHPGLDLAAPYRSPVMATAPGVVTFAGVEADYGRTVEISHGHGIMTRYAHLHRIVVARGEHVRLHQEIGELGATGRATGPHVHYEIRVDGVAVDPAKFLAAGHNVVQIAAHPTNQE